MNPDENSAATQSARIRQQAADWIVKRDAGFTAQDQDAFFEWLSADPSHAESYARLQAFFKRMDVLVEWRPMYAPEPNPDLLANPPVHHRKWRMLAWWGGLAASIALALGVWHAQTSDAARPPVLLAAGASAQTYENHVLEDGSVVSLNRGALVAVRFEPGSRLLDLISGEAYFQVARDPNRPFVVRVGGVAVTAVGTEFNIALRSDRLEVMVTKGRVRVDPPSPADGASDTPVPARADQTLGAGQSLVLAPDAPSSAWTVVSYSAQIIAEKLAWRDDLVDFRGTPLSEVILEFNHRNHTQLVIADAELARRPIKGSLRLTNLEGFLELLAVTHGVQAERQGTAKIVLRPASR